MRIRLDRQHPRPGRPPTHRPHRPDTRPARALPAAERLVLLDVDIARQLSMPLAETRALLRAGAIPAQRVRGVWTTTQARLSAWVNRLPNADPNDPTGLDEEDQP
ncbi:hypothetical protein [Candidatus Frankia nodulisporulans]|uniref:hypothetical protein n=1 Tax=Candidatus Frankia nodulisporulans TaxID=2060052 RepID=UPI001581754C|nr:hypothetical protein [Candidatus Frankia nodulisporulans]